MTSNPSKLPEYRKPPVAEVALSVQFQPIPGFGFPHMGLLWAEFKKELPVVQQHPPLPRTVEDFGVPVGPRITLEAGMMQGFPSPRVWFLDKAGAELVQVQNDRLVVNWRKVDDGLQYPRYNTVRARFDEAIAKFRRFLRDHDFPDMAPDQCEVTYVNHCLAGEVWSDLGEIDRVVSMWRGLDGFLPNPEEVQFAARYQITDDQEILGRLHVTVEPARRISDHRPLLVMQLVARGAPVGDGLEGVGRFLDVGHEWIVRGFTSITTPEMHAEWERLE